MSPVSEEEPPLPRLSGLPHLSDKETRTTAKISWHESPFLFAALFLTGSLFFFYEAGKTLWQGGLNDWSLAFLPTLFGGVLVFRAVVCLQVASAARKRLSGHRTPPYGGEDMNKVWSTLALPALALPAGGLMFYFADYCRRVLSVQLNNPTMAIPSVISFLLVGVLLVAFSVRRFARWIRRRKARP